MENTTPKKSLEAFRHLRGDDNAVEHIGNPEQMNHLQEIIKNPGLHSRDELVFSIMENYSGVAYASAHKQKEYEKWGGLDHGKRVGTLYGDFVTKYPNLVQLTLDPAFMNYLSEFMMIAEQEDLTGMNPIEVRSLIKEKMGYKKVYRGMRLTEADVAAIKSGGIMSSITRKLPTSELPNQEEFEAKILTVSDKEMLTSHFYGNADKSSFVSITEDEKLAEDFTNRFGLQPGQKRYVATMNVPVLELVHQKQAHSIDPEVESFVFWKINPDEILEIKEVL